ncbi:mitochondrial genome maintenance protein MGM101 [Pyricularia oryzae]|nr:mitochondrial genome maintenance protein MGM101 [Pyricularia oryzae]
MTKAESEAENKQASAEDDDEPDEWDKRIFSTGCSEENWKLTECHSDKKDWRQCTKETYKNKMSSIAARTLRPLRSCSALRARSSGPSNARSVSYWKPAQNKAAPAPSTPASTPAAPAAKKPYTRATPATARKTAPAPAASDPQPPSHPVLDPQAAAVPPPSIASNFAPVPEASSTIANAIASSSSSTGPDGGDGGATINWSESFHGLGQSPFSPEAAAILMAPLDPEDVEVKPDGILYLPEIKYRRILNKAFGPGAWGLAPRGDLVVGEKVVTREYALVAHGRYVSQARGECQYFSDESIPTAGEGCKSNALMRCCKDLGIGSELWDPRFIRDFKKNHAKQVWVEHMVNKSKRQIWMRKDGEAAYPWKLKTTA